MSKPSNTVNRGTAILTPTICYAQALEHYEDTNDIKRVVVHSNLFNADVSPFSAIAGLIFDTDENRLRLVARRLLRQTYRRAISGLHERDAQGQHEAESSSRRSDCHQILRPLGTRQADRNV